MVINCILLDKRPQYPDKLTVASTGEAATRFPSRMGEYRRRTTDQDYNNRPTYIHADGNAFLFYNDNGSWKIGREPRGKKGWIGTVKYGLLHIPQEGWKYARNGTSYEDPLLRVSYEGILL